MHSVIGNVLEMFSLQAVEVIKLSLVCKVVFLRALRLGLPCGWFLLRLRRDGLLDWLRFRLRCGFNCSWYRTLSLDHFSDLCLDSHWRSRIETGVTAWSVEPIVLVHALGGVIFVKSRHWIKQSSGLLKDRAFLPRGPLCPWIWRLNLSRTCFAGSSCIKMAYRSGSVDFVF